MQFLWYIHSLQIWAQTALDLRPAGRELQTNALSLLSILLNIMNGQFQNVLRCVTCYIQNCSISARRSQRQNTVLYDMLDAQPFRLHQRERKRKPLYYSLTHSNHVPVLRRAVVVFTRYSTSPFTQCSFVLRSNQALSPSVWLLPFGCIILHTECSYALSPILHHTANRIFWVIWFTFSCFFGLSAYLTDNQGVTHPEQENYACAMYKADRGIIEERDG